MSSVFLGNRRTTLALVMSAMVVATSPPSGSGVVAAQRSFVAGADSNTTAAEPDFDLMLRRQSETDETWRRAAAGSMKMEKISYRSHADDLDVPAFVFQPMERQGIGRHPAIVWVHENIRGHLYEHYIPYVRAATAQGYVVIAPEYRGSIGYGQAYYDAIDYGGAEVDDVITAAAVLSRRYPDVDPGRIGVIGWSHGGMIALLAVLRQPGTFRAAVAIAPVTDLFHRLAVKGVERHLRVIDPHGRFGGRPWDKPEVYRERSPLFHVDRLEDPLLVHLADNDEDVTLEESRPFVDALQSRKPVLAETRVYHDPPGGHRFDRQVNLARLEPADTPQQRDSWDRVWAFLAWHLGKGR